MFCISLKSVQWERLFVCCIKTSGYDQWSVIILFRMMMMTNPGDIRGAGRKVSLHPCHPSYEVMALKSHEVIVILITRALEVPTRMMMMTNPGNIQTNLARATHDQLNRAKPNGPKKWSSYQSKPQKTIIQIWNSTIDNDHKPKKIDHWHQQLIVNNNKTVISQFFTLGSLYMGFNG